MVKYITLVAPLLLFTTISAGGGGSKLAPVAETEERAASPAPTIDPALLSTVHMARMAIKNNDAALLENLKAAGKNLEQALNEDGMPAHWVAAYNGQFNLFATSFDPNNSSTVIEQFGNLFHVTVLGYKNNLINHLTQELPRADFQQKHNDFVHILNVLHASGVNINAADSDNTTALHYAVTNPNCADLVRVLLRLGADPLMCDKNYINPWLEACRAPDADPTMLNVLLETYPELLSATDAAGNTGFHYAAAHNNGSRTIHALYNAASAQGRLDLLDARNEAQQTPMDIAHQERNAFTPQVFRDYRNEIQRFVQNTPARKQAVQDCVAIANMKAKEQAKKCAKAVANNFCQQHLSRQAMQEAITNRVLDDSDSDTSSLNSSISGISDSDESDSSDSDDSDEDSEF